MNAKSFSVNSNESLRFLLLAGNKWGYSTLSIACARGYSEIIAQLISYAKVIEDGKQTLKQLLSLKQLLWNEKRGGTALHIAVENGYVDVIKLLLKTASDLGIAILEELIMAVNEEGKNAIQLMIEHGYGHDSIFDDSFKILEEDKYKNIKKQVTKIFENTRLESRYFQAKEKLIKAIKYRNIKKIKQILTYAKYSRVNPKEHLTALLLAKDYPRRTTLSIACEEGYSDIVQVLISYAKETEDGNHTLKQLLWNERYEKTALHIASRFGHFRIVRVLLRTAADLGIDILEEFIISVDEKGKNAIQLMVEHGHDNIFDVSFEILEEDKYQNVLKKAIEMFKDAQQDYKLHHAKKQLITAIENGNFNKIKRILINAKNSSIKSNESLRVLLLAKDYRRRNSLSIACTRGISYYIELLISYAKEAEDGNHTLKQLLWNGRYGDTALHIAAKCGCVDVIKLLLHTAADLGIENLDELITAVDHKGKTAIQLIVEQSNERVFADSFKMLEEDKYKNIRKKVTEMFENAQLENRLCQIKKSFITAIFDGDTKKVKLILTNAKNFDEKRRILVSAEDFVGKSLFHIACERKNSETIIEIIFYAVNMDDESTALEELLTKATSELRMLSFLGTINDEYISKMKEIVKSLIFEAKNNNRIHAVYALKNFKEQLNEVGLRYYQRIFRRIRKPFRRIRSPFRRIGSPFRRI